MPLTAYAKVTLLMHVDAPRAAAEVCYDVIGGDEQKVLSVTYEVPTPKPFIRTNFAESPNRSARACAPENGVIGSY